MTVDVAKWIGMGVTLVGTLVGVGITMGILLTRVSDGREKDIFHSAKIEALTVLQATNSQQLTQIGNDVRDIKLELKELRRSQ